MLLGIICYDFEDGVLDLEDRVLFSHPINCTSTEGRLLICNTPLHFFSNVAWRGRDENV